MKLGEIANVSIGILVNREISEEGEHEYQIFNLKNYEEKREYETVKTQKDFSDRTTKQGDLLFRLVAPNKIIYVSKKEENLLVPSQLCIIRANKEKINPTFLKWYLESQSGIIKKNRNTRSRYKKTREYKRFNRCVESRKKDYARHDRY